METLNFIGMDFVIGLLRLLISVLFIVAVLRLFDLLTGTNFKESFKGVRNDSLSFATYRGMLFIGSAILVGSIL